jgi:hypothetical protein
MPVVRALVKQPDGKFQLFLEAGSLRTQKGLSYKGEMFTLTLK